MAIFDSVEDANIASVMDTTSAATKEGFTDQIVDEGHILCAKPDTAELVDIFPDGSWEYQNINVDGLMEEMSGQNAALLAMYLVSEENKKLFAEEES